MRTAHCSLSFLLFVCFLFETWVVWLYTVRPCFFFVLVYRAVHMYDVRVDQLVSLQCVLWDGDEVQRAICQTVPRGWLAVPAQHRGNREVCGQRWMLWVSLYITLCWSVCSFVFVYFLTEWSSCIWWRLVSWAVFSLYQLFHFFTVTVEPFWAFQIIYSIRLIKWFVWKKYLCLIKLYIYFFIHMSQGHMLGANFARCITETTPQTQTQSYSIFPESHPNPLQFHP